MFTDFYHTFYYCFLILATIISLLLNSKIERAFQWLSSLIIITLISELTAKYIAYSSLYKTNDIVYHFFTPVEYFMYTMVYKILFESEKWDKILILSFGGLVILEILNTIFLQPLSNTPTNIMIIESVMLVFLSLALFLKIRKSPIYQNVLKEGIFWFNSSILFYYAFNILIWGFHNIKVYQLKNPPDIIYSILLLFSGILYLMYAASIVLNYNAKNKNITMHA